MRTPRFLQATRCQIAVRVVARGGAFALLLALAPALVAATAGGAISGSVSNAATGDLLEGVRVTLPASGVTVLTDNTGRFTISERTCRRS
jgi:uncharacterized BrkB/YihY/UPF0761 family membrane protein